LIAPKVHTSNLLGITYMVLSAGCFVLNDSLMKTVIEGVPPFEVLFVRSIFASLWLLGLLAITGNLKALPHALDRFVLLRGITEIGSVLTFVLALAHAAQADIMAIYQTTPLLIILAMSLFYGQTLGRLRLVLVLIGFAGALLVAQPGSSHTSPYVLLAFLTAFFSAIRDLFGRRIPAHIPVLISTFATTILVMICAFIASRLFETWVTPSATQLTILFAAAFLVNLGHVFTFQAFKSADAQAVAPFYYAFMVWGIIMGYLFFGDLPNALAIVGMLLILLSGLAIIYMEKRNRMIEPGI
jgi:drug/metabolite transporter (DMT)-like permease